MNVHSGKTESFLLRSYLITEYKQPPEQQSRSRAMMLAAPEIQDVSLNNWLRQLPTEMVKAHLGFSDADIAKIPAEKLGVLA
jgi:hypothetical protein